MASRIDPAHWLRTRPIAHRGLCAPGLVENALGAFSACVAAGQPIEIDVQLTADGKVVVFHDARLKRMTGVDGRLAETPSARLADLRLNGTDERIPRFAEVLDLVAGRIPILVEIKAEGAPGPLEAQTAAVASAYAGEIAVQSFNPESMQAVRAHAPDLIRGQLSTDYRRAGARLDPGRRAALRNLWLNHLSAPDFVAYDVDAMTDARLARLRRRIGDLPLILWTARYRAQAAFAARLGCNIIYEPLL